MALSNLFGWTKKAETKEGAACGTACGTGEKPAACGTACGASDK
ncbi:MAG: ACGX-repeat peptide [Lachnospiraceae bacterium]|nr:ACGX-repeat peptide [Lachnospiraceae bacterium]